MTGVQTCALPIFGAEHAWDEYMMERELTGFETMANEKTADMLYCRILENTSSTAWQAVGSRSLLTQNTAENLTAPEVTCFLAPQRNSVYLYKIGRASCRERVSSPV